MKVIANRQLHGVYGTRAADEEFDCSPAIATSLLKRKLVRIQDDDAYAVKAIQPSIAKVEIEHAEPRVANKRK